MVSIKMILILYKLVIKNITHFALVSNYTFPFSKFKNGKVKKKS